MLADLHIASIKSGPVTRSFNGEFVNFEAIRMDVLSGIERFALLT